MYTKYLSLVAALIAVANGIIIAGNDLVFGTRSGLPVVSAVIAVIFVALVFLFGGWGSFSGSWSVR